MLKAESQACIFPPLKHKHFFLEKSVCHESTQLFVGLKMTIQKDNNLYE